MRDYISREAAIEALGEEPLVWTDSEAEMQEHQDWEMHKTSIKAVPAADVRPVKEGHWIDAEGNAVPWDDDNPGCPESSCYCSECGEWLTASDEYPVRGNYCPNCGADMRKE